MRNPLEPKVLKRYKYPEAYCFITYRGNPIKGKKKKEVIWNSRDGEVPTIIYSKDGTQQLIRSNIIEERKVNHTLQEGDLYFADMTKARAKFLAKKIVLSRWNNSRYPLYQRYTSKKAAIFEIYKSLYANGTTFTILKEGRNKTTYMHKHFRMFLSAR